MNLTRHPVVLVSPLNWGLGHATRCVPIVNALIDQNAEVIIGSDGNAAAFLKKEFPRLKHITMPNSEIKYYNGIPAWLSIMLQSLKFLHQIKQEQKFIDDFLQKNHVDFILSDNRYGVYSKKVKSILITHQLQIKSGIFDFIPNYFIRKQIAKFNQCLIPDFEPKGESLAGDLSHPSKSFKQIAYIGPLSRFKKTHEPNQSNLIPILVSGPEPLKSRLIFKLIELLEKSDFKFLLLTGNTYKFETKRNKNIKIVSHLETKEMEFVLMESPIIISSGGYSSIMDYYCMQKQVIFIPFPGQTEQIYLSKLHKASKQFSFIKFSKLDQLPELIKKSMSNLEFNQFSEIETISSERLSQLIMGNLSDASKMSNFEV